MCRDGVWMDGVCRGGVCRDGVWDDAERCQERLGAETQIRGRWFRCWLGRQTVVCRPTDVD